ncbi:MAG: flagellar brake protein [Nitrosomonadales bacterium]|nr:flagellar brake protein [Nitrosomonadales bacterium]
MTNMLANAPSVEMGFDAIKLFPGAVVQLQALTEGSHTRHEVRFIGHIKDKSLLLTLPFHEGTGMWLQPGKPFIMRGFNGIHAYAFSSQVIRAHTNPFPYVHFSWPRAVECQIVRHSLRVNVSMPANVTLPDGTSTVTAMLDLSVSGTMLNSPAELGAVGDHLKVGFTLDMDSNEVKLELEAIIRNINQEANGSGYRIGIGFEHVSLHDGMVLHYFTNTLALKTPG